MGAIFSRFKQAAPAPPPHAVVISDDAVKVDLSSRGIRAVPKEICALKMLQVRTSPSLALTHRREKSSNNGSLNNLFSIIFIPLFFSRFLLATTNCRRSTPTSRNWPARW